MDLSADDPTLGTVAFSIDTDLLRLPKNASLTMTPKRELPPTARAGFELVARDAGNTITGVGAAIEIDRQNLVNGTDIGEIRITMAVSPEWVNQQGGPDAIIVTRLADDGSLEFLATELIGTDAQGRLSSSPSRPVASPCSPW